MDILIFGAALVLGCASAVVAYRVGSRAWITKFAIKGPTDDEGRRIRPLTTKPVSGLFGEISAMVMVLTIAFIVNLITVEVSLWGSVVDFWQIAAGLFATVFAIVVIYEIYACRQARKAGRGDLYVRRLARGYIPYTIYSVINFSAVIIIVTLIVGQTYKQFQSYQHVNQQLEVLVSDISAANPTPDERMVLTEQIYAKVREGASFMVDQINTLVLLIFCSFGVQYLVKHTRISQAYEPEAIFQFDVLLWLSIAVIAIYAWSVHFFVYDGFFGRALGALDANREQIADGGWQMLQRFNDLYLDLTERRGLTGFMISLTSDRGGLLLALGAAGWIIEKRRKRDAQERVPPEPAAGAA